VTKVSVAHFPLRNTDHPLSYASVPRIRSAPLHENAIRTYEADENARYHGVPGCEGLDIGVKRKILTIDILGLETSVESQVSQGDTKPGREPCYGGHAREPAENLVGTG